MQPSLSSANPVFLAYAVTCIVLSLNVLLLWIYSGAARAKSSVAINAEDGARYGAPVLEFDPPAVARILRAHRNAEATIYPFLLLGLVYVLIGGAAWIATPVFAAFTLARIVHSIVYLRAQQPCRTVSFAVSLMMILVLMVAVVLALLAN